MQRLFITIAIVVSGFGLQVTAFAAGKPSGQYGNRYFTHPDAARTYIRHSQYRSRLTRKPYRSQFRQLSRRGKIYISDQSQLAGLSINRSEVSTLVDLDGVLISGPRKGRKNAQQ